MAKAQVRGDGILSGGCDDIFGDLYQGSTLSPLSATTDYSPINDPSHRLQPPFRHTLHHVGKRRVAGEVSGWKGARQTHRGPSSNVRRRRQECVRRRHRENLAKTPTQFLSTPKSTPHRLTPSQTTSYTDQLEVFLCFDSISLKRAI